ncbi:hypothetical protein DPMN_109202 [Dreissena polymorpha]|uniref:Uncharacterized protein n=1 Tax=Dreissena polymorpha TaxID=45954 RepID=A0A9D4KA52_DREPO|nr:hypothetical protein DPMN_109202 [Dreissena polymorpha]
MHISEADAVILSQGSEKGHGFLPKTPVSFTGLLNRSGSVTPSQQLWDFENIPRSVEYYFYCGHDYKDLYETESHSVLL